MGNLKRSPYQLVALTKLLSNDLNAILICDGVGVGKTISAAYAVTYLTTLLRTPALVVCPPSLLDKWYLELKTKFQLTPVTIRSGEELSLTVDYWDTPNDNPRVFLLPSSLLPRTVGARFVGPIVYDEIHNYRNSTTNLWKSAKSLSANAAYRIGLSATPINNTAIDLAAELAILLNLDFHSTEAIVQDAWRPGRQRMLYPIMTRFSKDRLGIHFARREVHDVAVSVSDAYRDQVLAAIKSLRGRPKRDSMYLDEITYFRLAASCARAFAASTGVIVDDGLRKVERLTSILEMHATEPVIIFCEFEETARELEDEIDSRPAFVITGSVPVFFRESILQQFQNAGNAVLILTSVGAEGIDLQFCSTLINYDLTWNPMVLEQRIGRIDRIGQSKAAINIYNFIVEGSIDARIIEILGRKLGLLEGSILEPATVLGNLDQGQNSLFFEEELRIELDRAQSLAQAVGLTNAIIPEDYDVISAMDAAYCDGSAIRDAAACFPTPAWVRNEPKSDVWQREMRDQASQLRRLIENYRA